MSSSKITLSCHGQAPEVSTTEGYRVSRRCSHLGARSLEGVGVREECFRHLSAIRVALLELELVPGVQARPILGAIRALLQESLSTAKRAPALLLPAFCAERDLDRRNATTACSSIEGSP